MKIDWNKTEEVLGRELTDSQKALLEDDWKAFCRWPDSYSWLADIVNEYLNNQN